MAGTGKFEDLTLSELSLEPMPDPNLLNFQVAKPTATNPRASLLNCFRSIVVFPFVFRRAGSGSL